MPIKTLCAKLVLLHIPAPTFVCMLFKLNDRLFPSLSHRAMLGLIRGKRVADESELGTALGEGCA